MKYKINETISEGTEYQVKIDGVLRWEGFAEEDLPVSGISAGWQMYAACEGKAHAKIEIVKA